MSNSDSFIEEVTEELRRDRMFAMFRKYGWIGGLLVAVIVGGTAWNEWSKAKHAAAAQAFGDQLRAALLRDGTANQAAGLSAITATPPQKAVLALLQSAVDPEAKAEAQRLLTDLAADESQPQIYRDLANLRLISAVAADMPIADRRKILDDLAIPGRPLRVLAEEMIAYILLEEGKTTEARDMLLALTQDQESPEGLRRRATDVITTMGIAE